MRKLSSIGGFICILAAITVLISSVSAAAPLEDGKKYSWYSVPAKDGGQPGFDVDIKSIAEYGAYAVGDPDDKVIYLTFDFGYENGNVKKCLDAMNKNHAKGTFFILKNVILSNPDLIKEIEETGHTIGNHTMSHKNMCDISDFEEYKREINGLEELYEEKTGYKMSKFYRPPKGEFTKENLMRNKELGLSTIFWSLAYMDWDNDNQPEHEASIKRLLSRTHNGAVVLLHPTSATNAAILDRLLNEWKSAGYRFGTLDELVK